MRVPGKSGSRADRRTLPFRPVANLPKQRAYQVLGWRRLQAPTCITAHTAETPSELAITTHLICRYCAAVTLELA